MNTEYTGLAPVPIAIIGEAVAGEAAQTLSEVKKLVKGMSVNTFDLAEKLHKIKSKKFYAPKYNTFGEYAKTLDLKLSKSYYLVKLVEVMTACQIPREIYEPVGIAKLRIVSRIETKNQDGGPKMFDLGAGLPVTGVEVIQAIMKHAEAQDPEELEQFVRKVNGQVGENAPTWVNIRMTEGQREKWQEAVSLAKAHLGSVSKDADGQYKDASEGRCAEVIAVNYILDPNNHPEEKHDIQHSNSDDSGSSNQPASNL
jgi:hypothetical protein